MLLFTSSCFSANNEMGLLTTLLRWNDLDPPSGEEKLRNERVCKLYQHNRNPFVDHPEYASLIWEQVPESRESSYTRAKNGSSNSTRTIKRDNWEVRHKNFGLNYPKKKKRNISGYYSQSIFVYIWVSQVNIFFGVPVPI